jgi:hypothetical protein
MNLLLILIFEGNNNIAIADIAKNTTKRRTTLFFFTLIREKRRIIVKTKETQADLENVKIQIIIDSTVKIPNVILSHKHTLVINIPKETGIIKFA